MSTHNSSREGDPEITPDQQHLIDRFKETDLYYSICYQSPASIAVATADRWQLVDVNNGFERIFGHARAKAIGRTLDELDIIVDEALGDILRRLEEEPVIAWTETKIRTKDGEILDAMGSYMRLEIEGSSYVVIKLVDITQIRRLEREVLETSERERRRIGQDLHDDLGQWLDGTAMLARSLQQTLSEQLPDQAGAAKQIAENILEATRRARRLARGLAPAALAEQGLVSALEDYAAHVEDTYGMRCSLEYEKPVDASETTAEQLYRIIQEAVHNAARHSHAQHIAVCLRQEDSSLTAMVIDDGVGIPEGGQKGLGLRTMDYRARVLGGWLEIERREEGGTVVTCRIENAR